MMMNAQLIKDGRVHGQVVRMLGQRSKALFVYQLNRNQPLSNMYVDIEHLGSDFTASGRLQTGGTVSASYFQSVTAALSAGAELSYKHSDVDLSVTLGARYRAPQWVGTASYDMEGVLSMGYMRVVGRRAKLGAQLEWDMTRRTAEVSCRFGARG